VVLLLLLHLYYIPGFSIRHYSTSSVYRTRTVDYTEALVTDNEYLKLYHWIAVGVKVITAGVQDFALRYNCPVGDYHNVRWIIIPFDEDGNRLTGTTPSYVVGTHYGQADNEIASDANYGGCYINTESHGPHEGEVTIHLHSDVKEVWIGISGYNISSPVYVSGIDILARTITKTIPTVVPGYNEYILGINDWISEASPTCGFPLLGVISYDTVKVVGNPLGWACIQRLDSEMKVEPQLGL